MNNSLTYIFVSLLSATAFASTIPAGKGEEALIGSGYNTDLQAFQGRCVKGTVVESGMPEANIGFSSTIDQAALASELGFGAGGRFRYGLAEVSASAKFFQQQQSSTFSISSVYEGSYKFANLLLSFDDTIIGTPNESLNSRLSDVGRSVIANDERWAQTCGSEYVEQIERGAKLFYSIRIDFSSTEEKKAFETAFSYDSSYASVHAFLNASSSRFSRNTKVTLGALQIGGDVSKITELFNAPNDSSGAAGFVSCSFGQFAACDGVMKSAFDYATKSFPKQIATDPQVKLPGGGPANLNYRTKNYSAIGYYSKVPPTVDFAIKKTRRQLEGYFDKQIDLLGEIRTLLHGGTLVLSPRQRGLIAGIEKTAEKNLSELVDAAQTCYDTPTDCIAAVSELNLVEIKPENLVIVPETFQQFCVFSQSPIAPRNLRESILGMIEAAKLKEPSQFQGDAAKSDTCLLAHMVFSGATKISFAKQHISTIEPLKEYINLVEIDLSNNEIENLEPLRDFKNLNILNLHGNRVHDIEPISRLGELESLKISNNSIEDISDLKSSPKLIRVDARNNFSTVSCIGLERVDVCLSISIRTDVNFVPLNTRAATPFFMPSLAKVPGGRILILGIATFGEIFDPAANVFFSTGGIGMPSYGHASSALSDGRVLTSGGQGSLRRLAIYSPIDATYFVQNKGLQVSRSEHRATVLNDGRVLITGGWEGPGGWTGNNASVTAEVFDPRTNTSTLLPSMSAPRAWHTATLLKSGKVLIAGGFSHSTSLATVEIFDPSTDSFRTLKYSMKQGRGSHTATLLDNGKVLLAGGFDGDDKTLQTAEIFDPGSETFKLLTEPLNNARGGHSAIKLSNGKVLIAGGSQEVFTSSSPLPYSNQFYQSGEIFDPIELSLTEVPAKMFIPRTAHAMIEIKNGLVLIVGGLSYDASLQSEVFTYTDL